MDYNDALIEDCWNDYNFCMFKVKEHGYNLYAVKNQTLELCLEAVKQSGYYLHHVREQTPELIHLMKKNNIRIVNEYLKVTQEQMDKYYEQNPHLLLTL